MKVFGIILLALLVVGAGLVYADGARMSVNHSVSVTGVVAAPQEKVFALITDVKNGYVWRPEVKSVTTLEPDKGRDHWVEHLAHGQYMTFLATRTDPPNRREVRAGRSARLLRRQVDVRALARARAGDHNAAHHGGRLHQAAGLPLCDGAHHGADEEPRRLYEGHPGGGEQVGLRRVGARRPSAD